MSTENNGKRIFNAAVTALLAATVITASMAGCGSGDKKSEDSGTSIVTETQIVTEVVDGVYVDENGNVVSEPTTGAAKDAQSSDSKQQSASSASASSGAEQSNSGNSGSGNTNSGNSGSTNSGSGNSGSGNSGSGSAASGVQESGSTTKENPNRKTTPSNATKNTTAENKTKADITAKNLTIGGKQYNVGDKIVCTYYLNVPKTMLNFQGRVNYDASLLKVTGARLIAPASYGAMVNARQAGKITFNGSDLEGYDFTDPGYDFMVVEYEVLKTGTTAPAISFEVLTDTDEKSYEGSNGVLSNGASVWTVYE